MKHALGPPQKCVTPALNIIAVVINSASPKAEALHPVLPNATENPENQSSKGLIHWDDLDQDQ